MESRDRHMCLIYAATPRSTLTEITQTSQTHSRSIKLAFEAGLQLVCYRSKLLRRVSPDHHE